MLMGVRHRPHSLVSHRRCSRRRRRREKNPFALARRIANDTAVAFASKSRIRRRRRKREREKSDVNCRQNGRSRREKEWLYFCLRQTRREKSDVDGDDGKREKAVPILPPSREQQAEFSRRCCYVLAREAGALPPSFSLARG